VEDFEGNKWHLKQKYISLMNERCGFVDHKWEKHVWRIGLLQRKVDKVFDWLKKL
jgi:hypothetical protein